MGQRLRVRRMTRKKGGKPAKGRAVKRTVRKNKGMFDHLTTFEIVRAINAWIKSAQDRRIMLAAEVDHLTFAAIAEAEQLTEKTVSRRVHKLENIIFKHI